MRRYRLVCLVIYRSYLGKERQMQFLMALVVKNNITGVNEREQPNISF